MTGPAYGAAHDPASVLAAAGRRVALRHPSGGKGEPVSSVLCSDGLAHLMVWHLDGRPVGYGQLYEAADQTRRGQRAGQQRRAGLCGSLTAAWQGRRRACWRARRWPCR